MALPDLTEENSPPTTTVFPTSANALTMPSNTWGVEFAGFADTTDVWRTPAEAGVATSARALTVIMNLARMAKS
ncbi:hypothetical protein HerbRD11066_23460 [Herbidospora sp. RD11066]